MKRETWYLTPSGNNTEETPLIVGGLYRRKDGCNTDSYYVLCAFGEEYALVNASTGFKTCWTRCGDDEMKFELNTYFRLVAEKIEVRP